MKIAYCTNVRLPSERAHGHQIAQVCDALVDLGHDVTIFCPYRENPISQSYHEYYGAHSKVQIQYLGSYDYIRSPWFPGVLGLWATNFSLRYHLGKQMNAAFFDVLYTRATALLPVLTTQQQPVITELHSIPRRWHRHFIKQCNRCALVTCLTTPMANELQNMGIDVKTIVAPDAVALQAFNTLPNTQAARQQFTLPKDKQVIGYAGQLRSMNMSKGVETLLQAIEVLHRNGQSNMYMAIAGGPPEVAINLKKSLPACLQPFVRFMGVLQRSQIPAFLAACDTLVYPAPQSDHPFYNRDTSPMKLFEYMAARRPIISADLAPIRDILNEDTALLVPPGDPVALAEAIINIDTEAAVRTEKAYQVVTNHTWEKRMQRILASL